MVLLGGAIDDDVFWALREIASFLPLRFDNNATWDEFTGQCNTCREDILTTHLRGAVRRVDARTFELKAAGYCRSCDAMTPFKYHLHDDISMTGLREGRVQRWGRDGERRELQ